MKRNIQLSNKNLGNMKLACLLQLFKYTPRVAKSLGRTLSLKLKRKRPETAFAEVLRNNYSKHQRFHLTNKKL